MTIDKAIQSVAKKLLVNFYGKIFLRFAFALSLLAFICLLLYLLISPLLSKAIALAGFVLIYIYYKSFFKAKPDFYTEACLLLDRHFESKERIISFAELSRSKKYTANIQEFISRQITPLLQSGEISSIARPTLGRPEKILILCFFSLFLGSLFILYKITNPEVRNLQQVALLDEILENSQDLPDLLREKLNELKEELSKNDLDSQEVKNALNSAEIEISKAQERLTETTASAETPSSTKAPERDKEDKEEQEEQQQEQPDEQEEDREEKQEDTKEEEHSEQEEQEGEKEGQDSEQAQDTDTQHSKSSEEEDGKSAQQQEGQGEDDKKDGQDQNGEGEKGKEEEGEGQGEEESSDGQSGETPGESAQAGGNGEQGDKNDEGGEGEQPESGQEQGSLDKAGEALSQIKKDIDNKENSSEGEKQDSAEGEGEGDGEGGSEEGQEPQDRDAQSQQEAGKENSEQAAQDKNQQKDPKSEEKSGDQQSQSGQAPSADADKESEEMQESPSQDQMQTSDPQARTEQKVYEEDLQGDPWEGLGENKDFQDLKVQPTDEQYDTRHVAEEGELVKNEQEAEFKINLSDVKLAKPEIAGQEERQEIPLEYRDIMR